MIPGTLLVATDGSGPAKAAEQFAADMANMMEHCAIVLATVIPPRKLPPISPPQQESLVAHSQETGEHYIAAKKLLKEAAERVNDCVTSSAVDISTMIIEDNSPARGIVEHSDATGDCRLIVLGNRGHSGLASVVLGSVSSHVLHEAHCPVVIVRE